MKATELMVGDWVDVTRTECVADGGHYMTWSEYGKVVGITDFYIEVEVRDGEYNVDAHEDELNPIPLTPEILEKNFSSTTDWYFIGTDKFCFRIDKYKDKWDLYFGRDGKGTNLQIKISYVHELQHVLRLCGINKEIEL